MTVTAAPGKRRPRPKIDGLPKRMSEARFVRWALHEAPRELHVEWVGGEILYMSPSNWDHSDVAAWLLSVMRIYVEEHDLGRIIGTDFMARFARVPSRRVPDILFVARSRVAAIKPTHFEGAPDVIVEVVSPESAARDWREKFAEYETNGVREYWIIDPNSQHVEAYALKRKKYRRIPEGDGVIRSSVIRGFWIKTEWLWPKARPNVLAAVRALGVKG